MTIKDSKIIFLFPGQGSQYYHMGREIFDEDQEFRRQMVHLDDWFHRKEGYSLIEELYGSRSVSEPLDDIRYSHPLLLMLEYSLAIMLQKKGLQPSMLIGFSLGEYAANAFAGTMSIYRAMEMAVRQAEWANAYVEEGFLMAVLANRSFYDNNGEIQSVAHMAGEGFSGAFVLSGRRQNLDAVENILRDHKCAYQTLPVRVPFHSSLIEPMHEHWTGRFEGHTASEGTIPILSQYNDKDKTSFAERLWRAVREPGEFRLLIEALNTGDLYTFIDIGPSGTLANWIRQSGRGRDSWEVNDILSPLGGDLRRLEGIVNQITVEDCNTAPCTC